MHLSGNIPISGFFPWGAKFRGQLRSRMTGEYAATRAYNYTSILQWIAGERMRAMPVFRYLRVVDSPFQP